MRLLIAIVVYVSTPAATVLGWNCTGNNNSIRNEKKHNINAELERSHIVKSAEINVL